jgi:hypothetical protein
MPALSFLVPVVSQEINESFIETKNTFLAEDTEQVNWIMNVFFVLKMDICRFNF